MGRNRVCLEDWMFMVYDIQRQGTGPLSRMEAKDSVVGGETLQAGERTQHTAVRKRFDS